jgi:SAM-dependent methyltransferase
MIHRNNCPVCNSPDICFFLRCTDHLVTSAEFDLVKCRKCGFLFTQDCPDESEIGSYYESADYISHSDSDRTIFEKVYQLARKFMLDRKKSIIRKASRLAVGSVLDIGSGTGHFLSTMKEAGWETKGIEINKSAREYSASKFCLEVISPEEITSLNDQEFDCITMWHVMEHFHNPENYFKEIGRLLKPGGTVIVALPNNDSADSNHYGSAWAAYDVPRHLWHFNPATFSMFAGNNGFSIIKTLSLPLDVFYISILSERIKGSKIAVMSGIVKGVIFSFASVFNRLKSSSLIYILKKTGN